jgi:hypothetical protein
MLNERQPRSKFLPSSTPVLMKFSILLLQLLLDYCAIDFAYAFGKIDVW